ncbi:hypothetical protein N7520_005418 [Penicillium odoratum]|uniref:uncharacterized protein n=1 Tax=Penicillium odoratum TaxID=1167516 RepID=UPI0025490869|nr:uncharacterized protein N7520_005418 [Penicillium odoratum]KAJ5765859.1 hypothetical protein N7520_005418 [Penicillium odoratum]
MSSTIPEIAPPSRARSIWKGSILDDVDRDPVDVEDLDLEKSYVVKEKERNDKVKLPAKQTWVNPHAVKWPLYDIERLPEGWHPAEPDLGDKYGEKRIKQSPLS